MTDSKLGASGGQTREKIETLYSWAAFQASGYRDFSASRIDTRARFRYRVLREEADRAAREQERAAQDQVASISIDEPAVEVPPAPTPAPKEEQPSASAEEPAFGPRPQWLDPDPQASAASTPAEAETLLRAKERVASRWFGLTGLFSHSARAAEHAPERKQQRRVPVVAVFSFAGGVGKTSLIATLGRALASHGERVLLADTTHFGLLPFYFGARDLKPGVVRTFAPPNNSIDVPVHAVTLDAGAPRAQVIGQGLPIEDPLIEDLLLDGERSHRILVDIQTGSEAVLRRLMSLAPTVVVPLLPEMNSVVSVSAIESVFSSSGLPAGQTVEPVYLLNQFDATLPLHVDIREVLQEQLGDRLLPFVMRRSPAISEGLAEGMTVVDYAPKSSIAEDYLRMGNWLRSVSAAAADYRGVRWSER
jgi:cellulose synthase operon protein YhjQ